MMNTTELFAADMIDYDFNKPITATIIFEDSDEDNSSPDFAKKETLEESHNFTSSENSNVINKETENKMKVNANNNTEDTLITKYSNKQALSQKRQLMESENKDPPKRLKIQSLDSISPMQVNEEEITNEKLNYVVKYTESTTIKGKQDKDTHENSCKVVDGYDQSNKHNYTEKTDYYTHLLNSVSTHMIIIMDAYFCHLSVANNKTLAANVIENSVARFLRTKYHFFNLSYCTLATIILPQEHNVDFVTSFLNDTIKIANHNKSAKLSYEQILPLYAEMIEWAKQKEKCLNNIALQFESNEDISAKGNANTILKEQLRRPPIPLNCSNLGVNRTKPYSRPLVPSNCNNSTGASTNKESAQIRNYSFGPPGKQITLSFDATYIDNENKINKCNTQECINPSVISANINNNVKKSNEILHQNLQSKRGAPQKQIEQYPPQSCKNYDCQSQLYIEQQKTLLPQPHWEENYLTNHVRQDFIAPGNHMANSQFTPYHTATAEQEAAPSPYFLNYWNSRPPQKHTPSQVTQQQQQCDNESVNQESTRSLSTDSGFISPLHFSPNEPTLQNTQGEHVSQSTPFITHVTSLNPKAAYINEGYCHVCGKTTKKMCINCLSCYYCSFECQRADWMLHRNICIKKI